MTLGDDVSTNKEELFAHCPIILVVLHAILMVLAGFIWIRSLIEVGSPMVGPAANFWYDITRLESFPVSYIARLTSELVASHLGGWMPLSLSAAIGISYWTLLLVLGSIQWYAIGSSAVWIQCRSRVRI